jgi:RNA polymerase sigma factor (TIGR02999 family)
MTQFSRVYTQWQNIVADSQGHQAMFEDLYRELKIIARSRMVGEKPFMTLSATTLVHEAWLRLEGNSGGPWRDRSQFFAAASEAMRRILVEAARRRNAAKRGGGQAPIPLDGIDLPDDTDYQQLLEVNEVLDALEAEDPVKAQIVKMRFYCGMENEEIAAILGVNEKTVRRHWQLAKIRLFRAITEDE